MAQTMLACSASSSGGGGNNNNSSSYRNSLGTTAFIPSLQQQSKRFSLQRVALLPRISAVKAPEECNEEECAPAKEVITILFFFFFFFCFLVFFLLLLLFLLSRQLHHGKVLLQIFLIFPSSTCSSNSVFDANFVLEFLARTAISLQLKGLVQIEAGYDQFLL